MPMVFIRHVGANLAFISPIEGPVDPGWGGGGPDHIWGGVGGRPPHVGGGPIYHPGHPDHGLPSEQPGIDNSLPGGAGHPDNRPPGRPPVVAAGQTLVLVRDPVGVWHYATIDASTPPPKPVPVPPPVTAQPPIAPTPAPKA